MVAFRLVLHIHCGDIAAGIARRAASPGEVVGWKDSAAVGPCSTDPVEHARLRAEFWGPSFVAQRLTDFVPGRQCALWFGPDPWEQIALVEILAHIEGYRTLTIVPLDRAVGHTAPDLLPGLFARRFDAVPLIAVASELWRDFAQDDRPKLKRWVEWFATDTRLPLLSRALTRVLEDREKGRTEAQIRDLVGRGITKRDDLMRSLAKLEAPDHGVWYGDRIVMQFAERILDQRGP